MSKLVKSLTAAAAAVTLAVPTFSFAQATGNTQAPDATVTPPATVEVQPREGAATGTDAAGTTGTTGTTTDTDAAGTTGGTMGGTTGTTGGTMGTTESTTTTTTTTETDAQMRAPRADRN